MGKDQIQLQFIKYDQGSQEFVKLAEVDRYETFAVKLSYYEYSTFTFKMNINDAQLDEVFEYFKSIEYDFESNFVCLVNNKNKDESGYISSVEFGSDESGKKSEIITIRGFGFDGIPTWRIAYPPSGQSRHTFSATEIETIIYAVLDKNFVNPHELNVGEAANRIVEFLELGTDQGRGPAIDFGTRFKKVYDEIKQLLIRAELGIRQEIDLVANKIKLEVYEGADRTETGSGVAQRALFSLDLGNLKASTISFNSENSKNTVIALGAGEGAAREFIVDGVTSGIRRRETFADARDIAAGATAELAERANQKKKELEQIKFFKGALIPEANLEFRKDFNLGDLVTIRQERIGIVVDVRIIEVKRIYANDKVTTDIGFGTEDFTLEKFTNKRLNNVEVESVK